MTSRPSTAAPILAVLAVVLVMLLVAYIGGYFWLADIVAKTNTSIIRCYPYRWQVAAFTPLARAEAAIRGGEVREVVILTTSQLRPAMPTTRLSEGYP